jgi:uncharacterized protein
MKEQVTINSFDFAKDAREFRGTISPRDLERLGDVLFSGDGKLDYRLQGRADAQGKLSIHLHVEGELVLVCQRCLGALKHRVDTTAHFVIVPNEGMMPAPEDEQDDADYLIADPKLDVISLVEDEVLLGLPMVALHEAAECGVIVTEAKEQKESPFKVLQGLKLGKS